MINEKNDNDSEVSEIISDFRKFSLSGYDN